VAGVYQAVVSARVGASGSAVVEVFHSPVRLAAERRGDSVQVSFQNLVGENVNGEFFAGLIGGERGLALTGQGGAVQRIPVRVPAWANRVTIDLTMPREEWPRFTDFGASLVGADGQIIASEPLNYHTARLSAELPGVDQNGELVLLPGFADPDSRATWQLAVTIRYYAAEPVLLEGAQGAAVAVPVGTTLRRAWAMANPPWQMPDAFDPLGQVALVAGDRIWAREVRLGRPVMAVRP
jgi:hypothetical protein